MSYTHCIITATNLNVKTMVHLTRQVPPFWQGFGSHVSWVCTVQFIPPQPSGQVQVYPPSPSLLQVALFWHGEWRSQVKTSGNQAERHKFNAILREKDNLCWQLLHVFTQVLTHSLFRVSQVNGYQPEYTVNGYQPEYTVNGYQSDKGFSLEGFRPWVD